MARGNRVTVLGAALLTVVLGACHEGDYVRSVHATAVFDEAALDFGEVPVGEWRERTITVRNIGHVPFTLVEALEIEDHPSFVIDAPRDLLRSGESRQVIVRFHPLREGPMSTRVKVETDARFRPDEPLMVKGVGAPARVIVEPPVLDFETLEIDSTRTLDVRISNPADIPLAVSLKGVDAAEFQTDHLHIPPGATIETKATFAPKSLGDRQAQLEFIACEDCTPVHVEMKGRSVPHAFAFDPSPVPFPETPVHETTESFTRLTNIIWRPVTISELVTSDQAFVIRTDLRNRVLQPGESASVDLSFSARFSGPNMGTLDVNYTSDRPRTAQVVLDARGGQPQLALTPITIDFGTIPMGGKVGRTVRLTNSGSNGDLHLQRVRGEGMTEHFGVGVPTKPTGVFPYSGGAWPDLTAPDVPIAPGEDYVDVEVYFQPVAVGSFEARVIFGTDAVFTPEREVRVTGTAFDPGICSGRVVPDPIEFGNVPPDTGAILGFRFENTGTDICAVKDIHISDDGGGVFWMPGGELPGGVVLRDDAFSAMIAFSSKTPGVFTGELSITINDPANPVLRVPIRATAAPGCLVATPHTLDFGPIRYDCDPEPRRVMISNACAAPVTVDNIRIGPGTSDQYHIAEAPSTPLTLNPGDRFEVEVTYDRTVLGQHYSPLFMDVLGEAAPFLVPLWAETNHEGTAVDRFVQGQADQLDLLFVVSNTTTMEAHQDKLQAAIPGFIADAEARGLSLQVGVTTTGLVTRGPGCGGGANGGEAGRLFPVDGSRPRIVAGIGARVGTIQQNLEVGLCHNLPQGLETMRMALSPPLIDSADDPRTPQPNDGNAGFLRPSARLAVVFLADEDDHSGFEASSYTQFLQTLKGPNQAHRAQAYALVPDGSCETAGPNGERYAEVARGTGGRVASICGSTGTYAALLGEALRRAAGPQADFRLSFPVRSAGEITVLVDGVESPAGTWTFDAADNAIVFTSGNVPSPGQVIEVRYVSECGTVTQ